MHWRDVDWRPTTRKLQQFAVLWLFFFGALAYWHSVAGYPHSAFAFCAAAVIGGVGGLVLPGVLRPIYVSWMVVVFPLGWAVSHLLLAILFFGLFTPLAIVCKLRGRDMLRLRYEPDRKTYWIPTPVSSNVRRYFRPY